MIGSKAVDIKISPQASKEISSMAGLKSAH